ncbi:hypothetical protein [Micromonospora sp. NBC_00858]|uniref:hypothetical protein n=1 Tax=Micromonospora sp. NBC_00858 TaxID=2975979 RepID=UPI00386D3209|nr:hypothetical protein OG990_12600 [Micromonospora sp. NBC_00858]
MDHRLRRVSMLLLGAVLLGTVGLSVGSWYGGRGVTPPTYDQARKVAAEVLPDEVPYDSNQVVNGSRFDVNFAADDFGSGQVDFWYHDRADCALSEQLRRSTAKQGWQGLRRVPGYLCDGWRAERDGLTVTLNHSASGSTLTVAPAVPNGFLAVTVAGALLGAAAGATLFWLVARQRPPVPLLVGTLVTVGLLPGVAVTWMMTTKLLTEPVWPVWPALAPLLVPLWLVLLAVAVYVRPRRQTQTDSAIGSPGMDAEAGAKAVVASPSGTRMTVTLALVCGLTPFVVAAALILLFLRAQPARAASEPVVPGPKDATVSTTSDTYWAATD